MKRSKLNAQKEINFLLACNERQVPIDNVIYYAHTDTFCFGWRDRISDKECQDIMNKLKGLTADGDWVDYKIEYKVK